MTRFTWNLSWLGDVTLDVPDERAPGVAEALETLGYDDARVGKI